MATKRCARCKKRKDVSHYRKTTAKDGLHSYCRQCGTDASKASRDKDVARHRDLQRASRLRGAGAIVDVDLITDLRKQQNNLCAICGMPEILIVNGAVRSLAVDHCHDTGKVRGLLCNRCNIGIANLNEDVVMLQRAINYLTGNGGQ